MGERGRTGALKTAYKQKRKLTPPPIGELGQALWTRIVNQYPDGYFLAGDWPLLQAYCEEWQRHELAQQKLLEMGEVIETPNGSLRRNPWHDVLIASSNILSQIAVKLRLCVNTREKNSKAAVKGHRPSGSAGGREGLMFGGDGGQVQ